MDKFTDHSMTALVSVNHGLEDIEWYSCPLLTDASLIAIADNCHKLKKVGMSGSPLMTSEQFKTLLDSIDHDLQKNKHFNLI